MEIKFGHAVVCLVIIQGCILATIKNDNWWYGAGIGILLLIVVLWVIANETYLEKIRANTDLAHELSRMDPDQWQALGMTMPTLNIDVSGLEPVQMLGTSGVGMRSFFRFLDTSDARQISPERIWADGRQRNQWQRIRDYLITIKYVEPDSAAGSHSWLWVGTSYTRLRLMFDPLREMEPPPPPVRDTSFDQKQHQTTQIV